MAIRTLSTGSAPAERPPARPAPTPIARDLAAIFGLAALVRLVAALLVAQPGYTDAYYYYEIAANLAAGRGFVEDFAWNHLGPVGSLPRPSNAYWPPLPSIAIAPWLAIFGESFRAAQIPSVLFGAAGAGLGYAIGWSLGGTRRAAWWTGLLTLFAGVAFPLVSTTDSFALFGLIGAGTLAALGRASVADRRWYLGAGVLAGLGALTRADGGLLIALIPLTAGLARRAPVAARPGWAWAAGLAAAAIVVLPWSIRNLIVFGTPLPGGGLATALLTDYDEIFSYPPRLSLEAYLAPGIGPILIAKARAIGINLLLLAALLNLYLAPAALIGLWRARRSPAWWPPLIYAGLLLAALSLVFTLPGQRGAFFHSAIALQPFLALAALSGLDRVIEAIGARRPNWSIRRAKRNYTRIALAGAVIASFGLAVRESLTWDDQSLGYRRAAAWIAIHGDPAATVMAADAPGYHHVAGGPAIAAVNADLDATVAAATELGVRYLVIDPAHPRPWHDLYLGRAEHPRLRRLADLDGIVVYGVDG